MRVMQVVHFFPPDAIAGVERYTERLAAELARSGDTVSIVTRRTSSALRPEMSRERLHDGTVLYRFEGGDADEYFFLRHCARLEELFAAALVETEPDVVHFNHVSRLSPRYVQIARRHGAAVVMTLHDYFFACPLAHLTKPAGEFCGGPEGGRECARTCFAHEGRQGLLRWGFRTAYFRRLLGLAQRLIAPSRYLASFFERFGTGSAQLHVIPNGVPVQPARTTRTVPRPRDTDEALRLAFMGIVTPHKGVHVILEALRIARLDRVELLVLGRIPDYERDYARSVRQQADTIPGLEVRTYGSYRQRELDLLLADVDCVIVPSQLPENYPLVTQEAFVRGIPILASRLGGIPEIVNEGQNGYTFAHSRPDELAALLRRLRAEDGLLDHLREGARKTHVLTMADYADRVRGIYKKALMDVKRADPWQDAAEDVSFLHDALLDLGVG